MSDLTPKDQLAKYLSILSELVKEFCPFDVAKIQSSLKVTGKLLKEFTSLHDNLFDNVELATKPMNEKELNDYTQRLYASFYSHYWRFKKTYTTRSEDSFPNKRDNFTVPKAHENITVLFGMLENDAYIFFVMYKYFRLSFTPNYMGLENYANCNLLSPESMQISTKLKRLKPKWDELSDYKSKLLFWLKHGLSIDARTYAIYSRYTANSPAKNRISVEPHTDEEKIIWKNFFYEAFIVYDNYSLEAAKQRYFRGIDKGADPIPFTDNQISDVDRCYKEKDKFPQDDFKFYVKGYLASQNAKIGMYLNSPHLPFDMREFCLGVVDELYRRFLVEQKKELEKKAIEEEKPIVNPAQPFANLNRFYGLFDAFFINCGFSGNKPERMEKLIRKLWDEDNIWQATEGAKREIEMQILVPNNNADRVIQSVVNRCRILSEQCRALAAKEFADIPKHQNFYNSTQLMFNFFDWFRLTSGVGIEPIVGSQTPPIPKQPPPPSPSDENDVMKSTIEDYLEPIKDVFKNEVEYTKAVGILKDYFENRKPATPKPIFIKNGNKKKVAKQLGMLYQGEKNQPITLEYLLFIKGLFTILSDEDLDGKSLNRTNLYKYCTIKKEY